jgi:predicted NUDIX family NTP pyrophosphohydrolase
MEWPRKSGTIMEFPEIDRAEWFALDNARRKIQKGQAGFIDRLLIKTAKERESEG